MQAKEQKNEESLREMWDTMKHTNMYIMRVSEGEEHENGAEKIFKDIMAKNF